MASVIPSGGSRISPRRGRQLPRGAPTHNFAKFSQKLHEIERIWTPVGCTSLVPALDSPLTNVTYWSLLFIPPLTPLLIMAESKETYKTWVCQTSLKFSQNCACISCFQCKIMKIYLSLVWCGVVWWSSKCPVVNSNWWISPMIGLNMNDESFDLLLNKHFIPIDPNTYYISYYKSLNIG